jgi:glutamyl-tRNA reductase
MPTPKLQENQTFQEWVDQVVEYEKTRALKNMRSGVNPEQVLEQYADRLNQKIMHYIIMEVKKSYTKCRESTETTVKPVDWGDIQRQKPADHVQE